MNARADTDNIIPFPGSGRVGSALRLRVDLLLMPAPVWRRFLAPGDASFWDLHVAIQDAFGWSDRHLHQFTVDGPRPGERLRLGIPGEPRLLGGVDEVQAGWEHLVAAYLRPAGASGLYTYDLGDEWQHEVAVEAVVHGEDPLRLPRCLAGEGQAPPEDLGGSEAVRVHHVAPPEPFRAERVRFHDPRRRWRQVFGHD